MFFEGVVIVYEMFDGCIVMDFEEDFDEKNVELVDDVCVVYGFGVK